MPSSVEAREIPVIGDSLVIVGNGLLDEIPSRLRQAGMTPGFFVVVSDRTVFGHYGQRLLGAFEREASAAVAAGGRAPKVLKYEIEPGEPSKNRNVKAAIEDFMLEHRCTRDTIVVALGGGVVGDLSGFLAATYMRGVPVVQIPTSVMAMVDSSVGGKTAINVPAGKNLVGAFHQPRFIFADMMLLKTLHRREVVEGLAESIKMGVIRDKGLFELMEKEFEKMMALDPSVAADVIYESIRHKADVVAIDPHEKGLRATLNYGHTIGHAIEGLMSPELLHGECVAIGCVLEADLAHRLGKLPAEAVTRIRKCFEAYGLPVQMPKLPDGKGLPELMAKMAVDKKNAGGAIRCTIITGVGTSIDNPQPVPQDIMEAVLQDALAAAAGEPEAKRAKH
mmetsp:Transcript_48014/g.123567  ORF Transcript_48014/g.123567 Transcript_48014/m.123567 type:complete len:393 (+) Transcript_48014:79-1257(+)|eukprot:CAMPEP_0183442874 /NCGR_PEP_ID=MMETSP0370-20130417/89783_1 /TAXON_ID=268820 /ORGANISM="Peridinium aciculiferum, Strain PAER-2" /LENGTH=392 /DNA_ID=CAMNT_0025632665 /DNA_START=24 /DNA_END=1202 /DNA_ORIENTATION=-